MRGCSNLCSQGHSVLTGRKVKKGRRKSGEAESEHRKMEGKGGDLAHGGNRDYKGQRKRRPWSRLWAYTSFLSNTDSTLLHMIFS